MRLDKGGRGGGGGGGGAEGGEERRKKEKTTMNICIIRGRMKGLIINMKIESKKRNESVCNRNEILSIFIFKNMISLTLPLSFSFTLVHRRTLCNLYSVTDGARAVRTPEPPADN